VEFRRSTYISFSEEEQNYFDILALCVEAIRETVVALVDRKRFLYEGSKGGPDNPTTWGGFRKKESIYRDSIDITWK
jgi:hypothetical protein